MPQNDDLAAWFGALAGEGRGYCVSVVRASTPQEVLQRTGFTRDSVAQGTWRQLQQSRDATDPDQGNVVAAIAAGPDVLVVSDDPGLPVERLSPSTLVAGRPGAVFIADSTTMHETGHPLLAVTTEWDGEPFAEDEEDFVTQFRLMPDSAAEISTNLDLGNMDFEDFAGDGVHERWL